MDYGSLNPKSQSEGRHDSGKPVKNPEVLQVVNAGLTRKVEWEKNSDTKLSKY